MKICVIGTGYVGLVGAAIFADWGNQVVGVDKDQPKIDRIKAGEMPIFENGLAEIVLKNIRENRLSFTTSLADGIKDSEVIFICVGTPQSESGAADLSAVWEVAREIAQNLDSYKVIVVKSTVPVGTNERVKKIIKENLSRNVEFDVASNPEFLREGCSVHDMQNPDRNVIGSDSAKALQILKSIYQHLDRPIVECDLRSAELIKYASNAFLATKISFVNEMAQLCERSGADISVVSKGMGLDKRVGQYFLNAGVGYGGSCFPKDVAALYKTSSDQDYDFNLVRSVMDVNKQQKYFFMNKVNRFLGKNLEGKTIAVLGLAFKDDTDDIRESVSIEMVKMLRGYGASLKVFDPEAMYNAKQILGETSIKYCLDKYEAIEGSDALFLLTEWKEFASLDLEKVKLLMKEPIIFDGRNLLDWHKVENLGFTYFAVGKRTNGIERIERKKLYSTVILANENGNH